MFLKRFLSSLLLREYDWIYNTTETEPYPESHLEYRLTCLSEPKK